jgi:hypothetical protein
MRPATQFAGPASLRLLTCPGTLTEGATGYTARALTRILALAAVAVVLTGCQGMSRVQPVSQVRIIDASPDAPAIDIHQNSATGLYNVAFGTISSYIPVSPGAYTQSAYTAGTSQQLAAVRASFADGGQYTVITGNTAGALQMSILRDQSTPAPNGRVALRVLNQTTRNGAFDLYLLPAGSPLTALVPLASHASFGANTGYINAPSGTYSLVAFPAGSAPFASKPIYNGAQASYPSGAVRTLVLIDPPQMPPQQTLQPSALRHATPAMQVITANDFDPQSAS